MAFSDFPPTDVPGDQFWTRSQYLKYLKRYCQFFDLGEAISYNCSVTKVERQSSGWSVTVKGPQGTITKMYDAVAVCCGTHQVHKTINLPGLDTFSGTLTHSAQFKEPSQFDGRNVLVIGLGESGADVVREISNVSKSCHCLVRSAPTLVHRVMNGFAADVGTTRLLYHSRADTLFEWVVAFFMFLFVYIPLWLFGFIKKDQPGPVNAMGQATSLNFMDRDMPATPEAAQLMGQWYADCRASHLTKFATKNATFVPNVLNGKISMHIQEDYNKIRISEKNVNFGDGTSAAIDDIVFCVGYRDTWPFMEEKYQPKDGDVKNLFKHCFNPTAGHTLAYIGWARPTTGAIPGASELLSRYFAQLLSGNLSLPSDINQQIKFDKEKEEKDMWHSIGVRSLVSPCDFFDSVALLIGCYPKPCSWLYFRNPQLFLYRYSCTNIGATYRLTGPHAKFEQAKKWISSLGILFPAPLMAIFAVDHIKKQLGLKFNNVMLDTSNPQRGSQKDYYDFYAGFFSAIGNVEFLPYAPKKKK